MIREAVVSDVEKLSQLFDQYRIFYRKTSDLLEAKQFLRARLEKGESKIFVAFNDSQEMVGFVQLYPLFSSTRMKRLWLLNDLFILKNHRRKGYAIALIDAAKNLCKESNACGMFLETEKNNLEGNHLYPKIGFSLDEDHHYYFWDC